MKILSFMRNDEHIDAELFDLFLTSGIYADYAKWNLKPEQIDPVDVSHFYRYQVGRQIKDTPIQAHGHLIYKSRRRIKAMKTAVPMHLWLVLNFCTVGNITAAPPPYPYLNGLTVSNVDRPGVHAYCRPPVAAGSVPAVIHNGNMLFSIQRSG